MTLDRCPEDKTAALRELRDLHAAVRKLVEIGPGDNTIVQSICFPQLTMNGPPEPSAKDADKLAQELESHKGRILEPLAAIGIILNQNPDNKQIRDELAPTVAQDQKINSALISALNALGSQLHRATRDLIPDAPITTLVNGQCNDLTKASDAFFIWSQSALQKIEDKQKDISTRP